MPCSLSPKHLQLLFSWWQYCLLKRNTNAVDLMYYMTTHPGVAQNRKKDQRSSIFCDGKQCLSNSPEISGITFYFIILFYYHVFKSLFNRSLSRFYSTYIYYNNRSSCVNYVLIISMWYVRSAKPQISLRICTVWSEPLLVAWKISPCGSLSLPQSVTRMVFSYLTFLWNSNRPSSAFVVVTFPVRPLFSCKLKKTYALVEK